jgi:hypothetical protein
MSKYLLAACIFLFIISCEPLETYQEATPKAVVEAYLSPKKKIDILITKELPFSDSTSKRETLDDLRVVVETEGIPTTLKPQGEGHYVSDFLVQEGKVYNLSFVYDGRTVTAQTSIPVKPIGFKSTVTELKISSGFPPSFPDPLKLNWSNPLSDYHLVGIKNTEINPVAVFTGPFGGGNPQRQFRISPTQGNSTEIPGPQFSYYGRYEIVLHRINPEYATLYADNGNSSLNLSQPFTNVTNGLGIFTGYSSDTIIVNVIK